MLLATLLVAGLTLILGAVTIAKASIQLTANAEALKPGFDKATQQTEKFRKEVNRRLGGLAEGGEKVASAFGRMQSMGNAFNQIDAGANKLADTLDNVKNSIGGIVGNLQVARASGIGWGAALGMTAGGFAASALLSHFTREDRTPADRFLTERGMRGAGSMSGIESFVMAPFGFETAGGRRRRRETTTIGSLGESGSAAAEGIRELRREWDALSGMTAERARLAEMERSLELIRTRTDLTTDEARALRLATAALESYRVVLHATEAMRVGRGARDLRESIAFGRETAGLSSEEVALRRLEDQFRRLTRATTEWDDALRELTRAREAVVRLRMDRALAADFERGRAIRESVRTDEERARDELRELERLRVRGVLDPETFRRRVDAIGRSVDTPEAPIGVRALEAGTVEAITGIREAMREGSRVNRGETLLEEVRDETRRAAEHIRDLAGRIGASLRDTLAPLLRVFGV